MALQLFKAQEPAGLYTPEEQALVNRLRHHLTNTETEYSAYATLCRRLDEAYKPTERSPETYAWELNQGPKKLDQVRLQIPLCYTAANLKSNVLGMRPPKFNFRPLDRSDPTLRAQAEGIEAVIDKIWTDEEMDEVHLNLSRCLSVYGRGVLHDGVKGGETFTENIDMQANVWVSWRRFGEPEAMSWMEMVSEQQALDMGWDGKTFNADLRFNIPLYGSYPHDDILGVLRDRWRGERFIYGKVPAAHFYYKRTEKGNIHYALVVNGQIIHDKRLSRKDWPFTIVEAEHVPGLLNGVGDVEPLLDLQAELNQRGSNWGEAIRRNVLDQWKAWGLRAITPKMLPGGGRLWEFTGDKETDDILPLKFPVDDQGALAYLNWLLSQYRRVSGIPSEAEAESQTAGTSGFMATIKYQSLITSLAPRRIRMQRAYRKWGLSKLARIGELYPEYKEFIDTARFVLDVDWEEIAPRDVAQVMSTLSQGVASKIVSPYTAMEQLQEVPEDEMDLMREFNMDPALAPQAYMAFAQARMMEQQAAANALAQQQAANLPFFEQQAKEQALGAVVPGRPEQNQYNPPLGPNTVGPGGSPVTGSVGGSVA